MHLKQIAVVDRAPAERDAFACSPSSNGQKRQTNADDVDGSSRVWRKAVESAA